MVAYIKLLILGPQQFLATYQSWTKTYTYIQNILSKFWGIEDPKLKTLGFKSVSESH